MKSEAIEIDVRDLLAEGRSPLPLILNTVGSLKPDQHLRLVTAWEPAPLYEMLGRLGFSHNAVQQSEDLWTIEFRKEGNGTGGEVGQPPCLF